MRQHPKRYKDAGISKERLMELRAICCQYGQMKRELALARAGVVDRPRRNSGIWHRPDPTGSTAAQLADHPAARRVKLIEKCAEAVAEPAIAAALLRSVSENTPFDRLRQRPPCGRNQFYRLVQLFYIELDRALWESENRG